MIIGVAVIGKRYREAHFMELGEQLSTPILMEWRFSERK